jgi:hypothetical protein
LTRTAVLTNNFDELQDFEGQIRRWPAAPG